MEGFNLRLDPALVKRLDASSGLLRLPSNGI
jgi:hypothetical protein